MPGVSTILACGVAAACAWLTPPTEPSQSPPPAGAQTQHDPLGCRKVRFTIVGDTAVTGVYPDTSCGMQLELIAAGEMTWSGDTLTIPFRLRNRSASSVLLPVRLEVRDSAIVALEPEEAPTADVVPLNPDSTLTGGRRLWLVGGSGALGEGASTGVDTLRFQVSAPVTEGEFSFELVGHEGFEVALVPPDFEPAWFSHDSSYRGSGTLKRAVQVDFVPEATLNQRIAAITAVRGVVVGGVHDGRGGEQSYYVGLPWAFTFDSIVGALVTLENQSVVRFAGVITRLSGQGRRPEDGAGWTSATWRFSPDESSGSNWAAEEIGLPLAWGCETGAASTRVGIVDLSFSHGDFSPTGGFPGAIVLSQPDHGNQVASILASRGNNQVGMAGVVWDVDLRLAAIGGGMVSGRLGTRMIDLIEQNVRLINLSIASEYEADDDEAFRMASTIYYRLVAALEKAEDESLGVPLLVVSAGNHNRSADFAGPPLLRSIPKWDSLVVVVGASGPRTDSTRSRWGGSSFTKGKDAGSGWGVLVDLYAPGESVNVWNARTSTFQTVTGTSASAPQVAGIAALLFSFDPTLTAAEVKQLILEGAINGGRRITNDSTRYLANAYESLKLAAQKSGTPICGFPVTIGVSSGDQVVKLRRPGNEEHVELTSGTHTVAHHSLSVAPGGRAFSVSRFDQPSYSIELVYRYTLLSNGTWSASAPLDLLQQIYLEQDTVDVAWAVGNNGWGTGVTIRGPNGRAVGVLEDRLDSLPSMSTLVDWISPSLDGEYLVVGADVYADCWQDHGTWVVRLGNSTVERFVESECDWENWVYPRIGVGAAWSPYGDRFVLAEVQNWHPWDWDQYATPNLAFRARSPTAVQTPIGTDQVISNRMAYGHGRWYADPDFSFPGMGRTDPAGLLMHWVEGTAGGCNRTVRSTVSPFTVISDTTMTFGLTCVVQQVPLAPPVALNGSGPSGHRSAGREAPRPTPREGSALGRRGAGVRR